MVELHRNWDRDPDCDWVLRCSSYEEAELVSDIVDSSEFYACWDGNRELYIDDLTVLGNDSGAVELEEFLKKSGVSCS